MELARLRAKTKRKFVVTTDSKHSLPVAPDLVQRRFTPQAPNQLLCGDITYIATDEGWLYLAAVIDMFSRQVVGWSLQPHMQSSLVKKTACVHGQRFATREQARQAIMNWIAFYNHRRLHSSLDYLSPMQYEKHWYEAQRKKAA